SFAAIIDFYSPSLHRLSVSFDGLRLSLLQTYTASFAAIIDFYSPSLRRSFASIGLIPHFQAYFAGNIFVF
ncbi:hypothetical protein, partial [Oribacterium sinus]|uniref:hypothetical protein n=1 Tax=Oribacterium sinus TaxID=237576 RepID=UPI001A9812E3